MEVTLLRAEEIEINNLRTVEVETAKSHALLKDCCLHSCKLSILMQNTILQYVFICVVL